MTAHSSLNAPSAKNTEPRAITAHWSLLINETTHTLFNQAEDWWVLNFTGLHVCLCVCVCVCGRKREGKKEREKERMGV